MKFSIAFLILIVAATSAHHISEPEKEKLRTFNHECLKETGIDEAIFEESRLKKTYVEGNEKINKHCTCVLKRIKAIKDDGTDDLEYMKSKVSDTDHDRIEKCMAISAGIDTPCKKLLCIVDPQNTVTHIKA